jgi:hypothetical protein
MEKIIFGLFLLFVACSKKNESKWLEGSWKVKEVRIEDGEGFTYFSKNVDGNIHFTRNEQKLTAQVDYSFVNIQGATINDSVNWGGASFQKLGSDNLSVIEGENSFNMRIMLITKKALMTEYYDVTRYRLIRFVCVR